MLDAVVEGNMIPIEIRMAGCDQFSSRCLYLGRLHDFEKGNLSSFFSDAVTLIVTTPWAGREYFTSCPLLDNLNLDLFRLAIEDCFVT